MFKRLAIIAVLFVLIASAKTYTFSIDNHARAGTVELKPGEYSIKLDGSKVVLIDKYRNRIETTAKWETVDRKFAQTSVSTERVEGTTRILSIELGGSSNVIVFE